jgi:uncharacterized protein
MSNIEQNKQVAREFFKALGELDLEGLMSVLSPEVIFNVQNSGCMGGKMTLAELSGAGEALGAACPNGIRFDIMDLTAEDDRVSCRVDGYAKTGDGQDYNNQYHFLLKMKDGKIVETFEYLDSLLVERIFGPMLSK